MSQPATTHDVGYVLFCLLLDASGVAFGMGLFRVSTFAKRLARATDARWHLEQVEDDEDFIARRSSIRKSFLAKEVTDSGNDAANQWHLGMLAKDEREHQDAVKEQTAVEKMEGLSWHGCLVGDCAHQSSTECDAALAAAYRVAFQ